MVRIYYDTATKINLDVAIWDVEQSEMPNPRTRGETKNGSDYVTKEKKSDIIKVATLKKSFLFCNRWEQKGKEKSDLSNKGKIKEVMQP